MADESFEAFICLSRALTGDRIVDSARAFRYYRKLLVAFPDLDSLIRRFAGMSAASLVNAANADAATLQLLTAIASIWLSSKSGPLETGAPRRTHGGDARATRRAREVIDASRAEFRRAEKKPGRLKKR